jgi:histone H3/H4
MNTSGDVADELSNFVRVLVNEALHNARAEGRKTLMARDFENIKI